MTSFPTIVDSSENVEPILGDLRARGVEAVFRYYALAKQPGLPTKIVTAHERDAIFDAGLSLGIAFQFHNDKIATFTAARGAKDAEKALDYGGNTIQQAAGSAIYFGVDGDFAKPAELAAVKRYFEAVSTAMVHAGSPYSVGVYGSGLSCETLGSAGLATKFWIAKSTGYSGSQRFYNHRTWHLYQSMLEVPIHTGAVDTNWLNSAAGHPGTFNRQGLSAPSAPASVTGERRFVVRESDVLRKPVDGSIPYRRLHARENVLLLNERDGWSTVHVDEKDSPDLYIRSDRLQRVDLMP
jgi:hypothetical protein